MASKGKTTFGQRVLNFLKQGEAYHLDRYSGHQDKFIKKQIAIREEEIEDLNENLKDYKETHAEIVLSPKLDNIKEVDGSRREAESHTDRIFKSRVKLLAISDDIEEKQEEIAQYKLILKDIEEAELEAKEETVA